MYGEPPLGLRGGGVEGYRLKNSLVIPAWVTAAFGCSAGSAGDIWKQNQNSLSDLFFGAGGEGKLSSACFFTGATTTRAVPPSSVKPSAAARGCLRRNTPGRGALCTVTISTKIHACKHDTCTRLPRHTHKRKLARFCVHMTWTHLEGGADLFPLSGLLPIAPPPSHCWGSACPPFEAFI